MNFERTNLEHAYMSEVEKGWQLFDGDGHSIAILPANNRQEAGKVIDIARNMADPEELRLCLLEYGLISSILNG